MPSPLNPEVANRHQESKDKQDHNQGLYAQEPSLKI